VRPRVLLADDHTLVLEGLSKLLEDDCELVGTVEDGRALVEAAERLRPDVILLDISMPLLNGLEAARIVRTRVPAAKIIFLTMHADPTYAREAFRAGASGYLLKRSAASELATAISTVLSGRQYVTPLFPPEVLRPSGGDLRTLAPQSGILTSRQREVLQLVAEGHTAKEIAALLKISKKTVDFHKYRIMDRLGLRTASELTKYAVAHGVIELS
jgi:DNA-binding NarL/FixJ family response regulator